MGLRSRFLLAALALSALAPPAPGQNMALIVNANQGSLRVPRDPSLEPPDALTVECWIRATFNFGSRRIINKENTTFGGGYSLFFDVPGASISGVFVCGGIPEVADTQANSEYLNEWHHLAFTTEAGGTQKLYIDGALVAAGPGPTCMLHSADLNFGASADLKGEFKGSIDEVRIWNVARTEQEIATSWNIKLDAGPGLVSVWHLDGDGHDAVGKNDGTLTGTATFGPADDLPFGTSIEPSRGYWQGGEAVLVQGSFGQLPEPITVRFGDVASPAVTQLGPGVLKAIVPPGGEPGTVVAVEIESPASAITATTAFSYTPLLKTAAEAVVGEPLEVEVLLDPPADIVLFVGAAPKLPVSRAPWSWMLQCVPELRVFTATAPFQDALSLRMIVPSTMAGGDGIVVMQALVTDPGGGAGSFSNAVTVSIRP